MKYKCSHCGSTELGNGGSTEKGYRQIYFCFICTNLTPSDHSVLDPFPNVPNFFQKDNLRKRGLSEGEIRQVLSLEKSWGIPSAKRYIQHVLQGKIGLKREDVCSQFIA